MKRLILILCLALPVACAPACKTPPSARVVQVQTLKAVGQSAEATVSLSAHLYASRTITADQANQIKAMYDTRFQPAFRLAVAAVQSNLDSPASPDLVNLDYQLADLLTKFQSAKSP